MESNLITVEVLFADSKHNYKTSVNGNCSDESIQVYFVGKSFNVAQYPQENIQICTGTNIVRK